MRTFNQPLLQQVNNKLKDEPKKSIRPEEKNSSSEKISLQNLPKDMREYIKSFFDFKTKFLFETTCILHYGKIPAFPGFFYNIWQHSHSAVQPYVPYGIAIRHPYHKSAIDRENLVYPHLNRYNQIDRIDLTKPQDMFISTRSSLSKTIEYRMNGNEYCLEAICSTTYNLCSILKSCVCCFPCITIQTCCCCYGAITGLKTSLERTINKNSSRNQHFIKEYGELFKERSLGPLIEVMEDEKIIPDPIAFYNSYSPKLERDRPNNYNEAISKIAKKASQKIVLDSKGSPTFGNWYIEFPLYLAQCYRNGKWMIKNEDKAFYWYEQVIERIELYQKKISSLEIWKENYKQPTIILPSVTNLVMAFHKMIRKPWSFIKNVRSEDMH